MSESSGVPPPKPDPAPTLDERMFVLMYRPWTRRRATCTVPGHVVVAAAMIELLLRGALRPDGRWGRAVVTGVPGAHAAHEEILAVLAGATARRRLVSWVGGFAARPDPMRRWIDMAVERGTAQAVVEQHRDDPSWVWTDAGRAVAAELEKAVYRAVYLYNRVDPGTARIAAMLTEVGVVEFDDVQARYDAGRRGKALSRTDALADLPAEIRPMVRWMMEAPARWNDPGP